jgi:hypothetical protein
VSDAGRVIQIVVPVIPAQAGMTMGRQPTKTRILFFTKTLLFCHKNVILYPDLCLGNNYVYL